MKFYLIKLSLVIIFAKVVVQTKTKQHLKQLYYAKYSSKGISPLKLLSAHNMNIYLIDQHPFASNTTYQPLHFQHEEKIHQLNFSIVEGMTKSKIQRIKLSILLKFQTRIYSYILIHNNHK